MATTTQTTIAGERIELEVGRTYRVRSNGETFDSAVYKRRAANGSLVFAGVRIPLRPKYVEAIMELEPTTGDIEAALDASDPEELPGKLDGVASMSEPLRVAVPSRDETLDQERAREQEIALGEPAVAASRFVPDAETLARWDAEGHNRIWRCPTCKRRTRKAECANGHAAVAAPLGKRRDAVR